MTRKMQEVEAKVVKRERVEGAKVVRRRPWKSSRRQ